MTVDILELNANRSSFRSGFAHVFLIFVLQLSLLLSFSTPAFSDEVEVSNVFFPVERREFVDATSEKLTLGGREQILSLEEVPEAVVRYYFEESQAWRKVSRTDLEHFIFQSTTDSKTRWAALGLLALHMFPDSSVDTVDSFLPKLKESSRYAEVMKVLIGLPGFDGLPPEIRARLVFESALIVPEFVRSKGISLVFRDLELISQLFKESYLRAIGEPSKRQFFLNVARELLGSVGNRYEALRAAEDALKLFESGLISKDRARLQLGFERGALAGLDKGAIEQAMVRMTVDAAERDIDSENYIGALTLLSTTPDEYRTPSIFQTTYRAIESLPDPELGTLLEPTYRRFLESLLKADGSLRALVQVRVLDGLMLRVSDGRFSEAERLFDIVLISRADPSPENDLIRAEVARSLLRDGRRDVASLWIGQVRTELPLEEKLKLFIGGAYGYRWVPFLLILFLMAAYRIIYRTVRSHAGHRRGEFDLDSLELDEEEDESVEERINFRMLKRVQQTTPEMEEYLKCLNALGLTEKANLKQIKDSYRREVKKFHPDRISESNVSGEDFMNLTKTYQRCIELRKRLAVDA